MTSIEHVIRPRLRHGDRATGTERARNRPRVASKSRPVDHRPTAAELVARYRESGGDAHHRRTGRRWRTAPGGLVAGTDPSVPETPSGLFGVTTPFDPEPGESHR